jgi:hypothetical protein
MMQGFLNVVLAIGLVAVSGLIAYQMTMSAGWH